MALEFFFTLWRIQEHKNTSLCLLPLEEQLENLPPGILILPLQNWANLPHCCLHFLISQSKTYQGWKAQEYLLGYPLILPFSWNFLSPRNAPTPQLLKPSPDLSKWSFHQFPGEIATSFNLLLMHSIQEWITPHFFLLFLCLFPNIWGLAFWVTFLIQKK